jgi:hypothetical protein
MCLKFYNIEIVITMLLSEKIGDVTTFFLRPMCIMQIIWYASNRKIEYIEN